MVERDGKQQIEVLGCDICIEVSDWGEYSVVDSPQCLVGLIGQVQIEPSELLVVTPHQDIVSARMNIHTAYPLQPRLECLEQFLSSQVVELDVTLRSGEEVWLRGMEGDSLYRSRGLAEWGLGRMSC